MKLAVTRYVLALSVMSVLPVAARAQDASRAAPAAGAHEDVLLTLKKLIDTPAPQGLNDKHRAEYTAHTKWLQSAYDRVLTARERASGMATGRAAAAPASDAKTPRDAASGLPTGKRQHGVSPRDMMKLEETLEEEGRQFNTLSNASKARHEMAMNAIRNLK